MHLLRGGLRRRWFLRLPSLPSSFGIFPKTMNSGLFHFGGLKGEGDMRQGFGWTSAHPTTAAGSNAPSIAACASPRVSCRSHRSPLSQAFVFARRPARQDVIERDLRVRIKGFCFCCCPLTLHALSSRTSGNACSNHGYKSSLRRC